MTVVTLPIKRGGTGNTCIPVTGTATLIGNIGFEEVFGLAYGPDNVVYSLSNKTHEIFEVDLQTGAGKVTASFSGTGLRGVNGSSFFDEAD